MKKVKFDIQGMTCSSCSSHVERIVNKLDGIKSVNVNLLSNNMTVEYDEEILNNDKIISSVIAAGYGANVNSENDKKSNKIILKQDDIVKSMKRRLVISISFLIPLMYIAMNHMLNELFGMPIPNFIKQNFHGAENSITFGLTQFLLLLPIIYENKNYFSVGFKRLLKGSPNMDSLIAIGSSAATIYGIFAIYMMGYGLGHNQIELVEKYSMDVYFESAGTILTLITLRKIFRNKIKEKNK